MSLNDLIELKACKDGLNWFKDNFGNDGEDNFEGIINEINDLLDGL